MRVTDADAVAPGPTNATQPSVTLGYGRTVQNQAQSMQAPPLAGMHIARQILSDAVRARDQRERDQQDMARAERVAMAAMGYRPPTWY